MVFAKKKLRSLFPDSPVSKNGANDIKCTVRMLGRSVRALSRKANEVFGHWLFDTPIWVWLKNIYVPKYQISRIWTSKMYVQCLPIIIDTWNKWITENNTRSHTFGLPVCTYYQFYSLLLATTLPRWPDLYFKLFWKYNPCTHPLCQWHCIEIVVLVFWADNGDRRTKHQRRQHQRNYWRWGGRSSYYSGMFHFQGYCFVSGPDI